MLNVFNPKYNFLAFKELISIVTRHKTLTLELAKREITDRYTGQFFGLFWTFFHPLVQVGIYIFIFNFIFVSRTSTGVQFNTPLYILAGFFSWFAIQDTMGKSNTLIITNKNLVKQIIFPLEVLPIKTVLATLMTESILVILTLLYALFSGYSFTWTVLIIPFYFAIQAIGLIGISYILSSIGVFFRDIKDFVQVFLSIGIWFIPVLYMPDAIPSSIRLLLYLNPFSYFIWVSQDIFYFGYFAHPWAWVIDILISLVIFIYGYRLFRKLKTMFGNML